MYKSDNGLTRNQINCCKGSDQFQEIELINQHKRDRDRETYFLRSSDDSSDSFGGLVEDRISVNSVKADIGGDLDTWHLG